MHAMRQLSCDKSKKKPGIQFKDLSDERLFESALVEQVMSS